MIHGLRTSLRFSPSTRLSFALVFLWLLSAFLPIGAQARQSSAPGVTPPQAPSKERLFWREALSSPVGASLLLAQQKGSGNLTETMKKAAERFSRSDYTSAIALWTQVITSNPAIGLLNEALVNRAKAYLIVGQPLLALADLEANRYQPNETRALAELWLLKGSALLQNKQYPEAIAAFANAEKLQPPNPMLLANRSVAYQSLGNMAAARTDLMAAIRLQPNLSNYFNLAVLERLSGNYASCYKLLSEIIAKSQPYAKLFVQRGLCAARLNQQDIAIADMLKALKLEENNVEALEQIGISLAAKQQKEPAKQYLLKASSLRLASGQIEEYKRLLAIIASLEKR